MSRKKKPSTLPPPQSVFKIRIGHSSSEEITRRGRSDDCWDRDDTKRYWSFDGNAYLLEQTDQYTSYDIAIGWEPVPGQDYFHVVAIFSTGDSFGHDEDGRIEFFGLYKTYDEAYEVARVLNSATGYDIKLPDGSTAYIPWNGYFESLTEIKVERVCMKRELPPRNRF